MPGHSGTETIARIPWDVAPGSVPFNNSTGTRLDDCYVYPRIITSQPDHAGGPPRKLCNVLSIGRRTLKQYSVRWQRRDENDGRDCYDRQEDSSREEERFHPGCRLTPQFSGGALPCEARRECTMK
jgi:hypothetical protein